MLTGIKIIDFSNYLPGPFATLRLAELGAEIIKVEPLSGDPARSTGIEVGGTGVVFMGQNRQKKSIALNLKTEEGREIAIQLIAKADAVIESFRPGVMEKLRLDYETVKHINPGIVYCSITGYGNDGELSKLGSHDLNYMGISGVLSQLKDKEGVPIHPTIQIADYYGGFAASERLLSGLVSKFRTGKGSYHCISMAEVMATILGNHLLIESETSYPLGIEELNGNIISYAIYETKDHRYMTLGALEEKFWQNFCQAVGKEQWINAHLSKTNENNPIYLEVKELFVSRTFEEWVNFSEKVDCCLAPVNEILDLKEALLFKKNSTVFSSEGLPQVKMHSGYIDKEMSPPPSIGEQTEAILKEWLNIEEHQIAEWNEKGILSCSLLNIKN